MERKQTGTTPGPLQREPAVCPRKKKKKKDGEGEGDSGRKKNRGKAQGLRNRKKGKKVSAFGGRGKKKSRPGRGGTQLFIKLPDGGGEKGFWIGRKRKKRAAFRVKKNRNMGEKNDKCDLALMKSVGQKKEQRATNLKEKVRTGGRKERGGQHRGGGGGVLVCIGEVVQCPGKRGNQFRQKKKDLLFGRKLEREQKYGIRGGLAFRWKKGRRRRREGGRLSSWDGPRGKGALK